MKQNVWRKRILTRPYLILIIGSIDFSRGEVMDSIKVANSIIQLAHHLCLTSGAKGAIVCSLMQRKLGRYLSAPCEVDIYIERVVMANDFLTEVVPCENDLTFWRQKGLLGPIGHCCAA